MTETSSDMRAGDERDERERDDRNRDHGEEPALSGEHERPVLLLPGSKAGVERVLDRDCSKHEDHGDDAAADDGGFVALNSESEDDGRSGDQVQEVERPADHGNEAEHRYRTDNRKLRQRDNHDRDIHPDHVVGQQPGDRTDDRSDDERNDWCKHAGRGSEERAR